ncbi:MAG: tyrosine--tRNA ligase, partial [Chakrabartia sp.]
MGGSDQWGNIVNGIELTRRIDGVQAFGLTTPLITLADGGKMGKTASGAVWLNADALSPYDYWQFWRNTQDGDVGRFLRLFTDLPLEEIARLEKLQGAEINDAKRILANEATAMCHGADAAQNAAATAQQVFEQGSSGDDLPTLVIASGEINVLDALVQIGFVSSRGEAKRKVAEGAVKADDEPVTDSDFIIQLGPTPRKISLGKKKHGLLTQ